ncbi:unnamed protein product [Adineta steineri]|uniref:Uncharacterized protein n=1 Tax=Adineta steineri TaxID=433720 RepID=A0A816A6P8_9BILA|nr:unnamed protein product [Adineta steineri]CAF1592187.1 unnamed protein product [Adineta steineri]
MIDIKQRRLYHVHRVEKEMDSFDDTNVTFEDIDNVDKAKANINTIKTYKTMQISTADSELNSNEFHSMPPRQQRYHRYRKLCNSLMENFVKLDWTKKQLRKKGLLFILIQLIQKKLATEQINDN